MPRLPRIAIARYPHHVVQRGHNRGAVFLTVADRLSYLATLAEFRALLDLKVYAYCLMSNHVHLIVDPGDDPGNLSRLMKRLAGRHTRRVNVCTHRTGTAWEGRFKCSPIESDRYLLACNRYVELNPVRAGVVRRPADYLWSSYRAKIGIDRCDWLDLDPAFLALGRSAEQRRMCYRKFVDQGIGPQELAFIRGAVQRNQLTGSERLMQEVERGTGIRVLNRTRGRPHKAVAADSASAGE
jgi:putative transposase